MECSILALVQPERFPFQIAKTLSLDACLLDVINVLGLARQCRLWSSSVTTQNSNNSAGTNHHTP